MFASSFRVPELTEPLEAVPLPAFSILIPAYEAAATVADAVASALSQTRPAEVIVCDDGSPDDLQGALAPYRDRIQFLRKHNGGGASALNAAARAATGDFVAVLDADDVYDARRIEALAELAAARPDLDIVTTDAYLESGGEIVGRFNRSTPFAVKDQRVAIMRSCFVGGWPAVRRARVLGAGGWDESFRIGYDWDRWLRLILDGARAGLVDEPLMSYRLHGSLTANRIESLQERVRLLEKALDHSSLTRRERRVLRASIRWQRSRLLREVARVESSGGWKRAGVLAAQGRELVARARFASAGRWGSI
jgi:glycosyltransferase involved in cell wall biosynthesis